MQLILTVATSTATAVAATTFATSRKLNSKAYGYMLKLDLYVMYDLYFSCCINMSQ